MTVQQALQSHKQTWGRLQGRPFIVVDVSDPEQAHDIEAV